MNKKETINYLKLCSDYYSNYENGCCMECCEYYNHDECPVVNEKEEASNEDEGSK